MARLPQGVIKRPDGRLQKRFTVDGKRYSVYGYSAKELSDKESKKRKEIDSGIMKIKSLETLNNYFNHYIDLKSGHTKQSTLAQYKSVYKVHIKPYIGEYKLKTINKQVCLNLRKQLQKNDISCSRINEVYKLLGAIFTMAVEDDLIIKSPIQGIKPLKNDNKEKASETIHRALTEEEQKAFTDGLKAYGIWYYELFALLLLTGLRINEALALTWSDIDYKNNVITITKTRAIDLDYQIIITSPKSATSNRTIPMNDNIKRILKMQRKKLNTLASYKAIGENVFYSVNGIVPREDAVNYQIESTLNRLAKDNIIIERFTVHALRDTFATRFIEQGGTMQTLKTILGHSSLKLTMDLYAHVLPNTKQKEMNMVNIAI